MKDGNSSCLGTIIKWGLIIWLVSVVFEGGAMLVNNILDNIYEAGYEESTGNRVYFLNEKGYKKFDKYDQKSGYDEDTGKAPDVPSLDTLTVGETYYLVAYTHLENPHRGDLDYNEPGELHIRVTPADSLMSPMDAIEVLEVKTDGDDAKKVEVVEQNQGMGPRYEVTVSKEDPKVEFRINLKVRVKAQAQISVYYRVAGESSRDGTIGDTPGVAIAAIDNPQKLSLDNFEVSFLRSEDYINGRYDASKLVPSVDFVAGERYYMVVTASMSANMDPGLGKTVSFGLRLSPNSLLDGTLEYADSGEFSEIMDGDDKVVSATVNAPDTGEKTVTFLFKLEPQMMGEASIHLFYESRETSLTGMWNTVDRILSFDIAPGN